MYFNKKNKFFHGIMFHHFHDNKIHKKGQGSISGEDFYKMIKFIGRKNILDANVFHEKYKNKKLKDNEVCLTFDDAIKCQIDIAVPILEEFNIKSFFFIYTSIFDGNPDKLEIFRYFRMNFFNNLDDFYKNFYIILEKDLSKFFEKNKKKINATKIKFPFYSNEDIKFRLVRDFFLTKDEYEKNMFLMMKEKKVDYNSFLNKLFFEKKDLLSLNSLGHTIGLHSHSHPTVLENLDYNDQKKEYIKCLNSILRILKKPKQHIKSMSHPCGSYNRFTLEILKELGIEIGFKQIMNIEREKGMKKINNSSLEIARQDHSGIFKMMYK